MSHGDAVSNPFGLTTVACCLKIRTDSAAADGVTSGVDELEQGALTAVTVDLSVRRASRGEQAGAARSGHEDLAVKLRESLSSSLADRVVSAWQVGLDAGSLAQAADAANAAADGIRSVVEIPVEKAADAAGVPQCPAEVGAGVIATFVTEPVTRPITDLAALIEIAGVIIGLTLNIHPLAMACANRLAKKEIADLVAKAAVEVMNSLDASARATEDTAEEAAASQPDPQDPADARLSVMERRQLDTLREAAGYIGPEVQNEPEAQKAGKILREADEQDEAATGHVAAANATEEPNAV